MRSIRVSRGPILVGSVELHNGAFVFDGEDPPVDGTTGKGHTKKGSLYICVSTGDVYRNMNTISSPVWRRLTANLTTGSPPSPADGDVWFDTVDDTPGKLLTIYVRAAGQTFSFPIGRILS